MLPVSRGVLVPAAEAVLALLRQMSLDVPCPQPRTALGTCTGSICLSWYVAPLATVRVTIQHVMI